MKNGNNKIKYLRIYFVIGLMAVGAAFSARAADLYDVDDMDLSGLLDNIVISASKHAETLDETPANVFIITRDMIENYGCQSIGEALSMAPGIYITDDYSLTQVGIRGISDFGDWNSHVMVLIDGRPMNEQYGGTASIDATGLDIDNIERIEVIKGPSSSLYGSNAFFGMINLITKAPLENSIEVSSKYASALGTKSTSLELFHRFNKDLTIHMTGTYLDNDGSKLYFSEYSDISDGTLLTQDDDGYNQFYLDSASFTRGWSDGRNTLVNFSSHNTISYRDFYATIHYANMKTGLAQSAWGSVFNRPENRFKEMMFVLDLGYSGPVSPTVDLSARIGYTDYQWSDHILYNYSVEEINPDYLPGPIWKDWEEDKSVAADVKVHARLSETHVLVAGAEVQFHRLSQAAGETDQSGELISSNVIPTESINFDGQIYNAYVQSEHQLSSKLKAVGGLHFNHFSYTSGKIMPKAALIFKPYEKGTIKAIAGRGFRSPTFYEIAYTDGEFYAPNANLKPETISSYELIGSHEFSHGISTEIAINHSRVTNLINQTIVDLSSPAHPGGDFIDEVLMFHNVGAKELTSAEWSIKRATVYRLSGFANVTYQKAKDRENPRDFVYNSPKWLGNFGLNYKLVPGLAMASVRVQYISTRNSWDGSVVKPATIVDVTGRLNQVFSFLKVSMGIKNLFDTDYRVPISFDYAPSTSFERPGRSFYFGIGSQF